MTQPKYSVFYGIKELHRLHAASSLAFDTETLQLQPEKGKLRLLQLGSYTLKTIVVIDCFELTENNWNYLQRFFTNGARFWLAHNAVFDLGWLQEHDIDIRGKVRCSMLASRLLTNGIPKTQHGLAHVAKRYLDIDVSKEQQSSHWGADVLSQAQLEYAAKDIEVLLELDQILDHKLSSDQLMEAYTLECLALPAMAQMWRTGLPWNRSALEQRRIDYEDDLKDIYNSRTYCLYEDIEMIKKNGLAKGGSLENAIVVKDKEVLNPEGLRNEKEFSEYNFDRADINSLYTQFEIAQNECKNLLNNDTSLPLPAYDECLKSSHIFNLLDARGAISVSERQGFILKIRDLARCCCEAYMKSFED